MFDLISAPASRTSSAAAAAMPFLLQRCLAPQRYYGPERRAVSAPAPRWSAATLDERLLSATLDEVDYGIVLMSDSQHAVFVNRAARAELTPQHPLQLVGQELHARLARDVVALCDALVGASRRGLRKFLTLGEGSGRVSVSVVPLAAAGGDACSATLVILGKRQVCEALSVQAYARSYAMTPAETRVLTALCDGLHPSEIARRQGVAISTVRSQIGTIRVKTGAGSIRALVRQLSVLPPLMGILHGSLGPATEGANDMAALRA